MLLTTKTIGPLDTLRFSVDYVDWLDAAEVIRSFVVTTDTAPATVANVSISADGKMLYIYVSPNNMAVALTFNVLIQITTVIQNPPPLAPTAGQTKNDKIAFLVTSP